MTVDDARARAHQLVHTEFGKGLCAGVTSIALTCVGLPSPRAQRTDLRHYRHTYTQLTSTVDAVPAAAPHLASGAGRYPIGKLVSRQQLEGHSAAQACRYMMREGLPLLYQGSQPLFVQRGLQIGLMCAIYTTPPSPLARPWQHTQTTRGRVCTNALRPLRGLFESVRRRSPQGVRR